MKCGQCGGKLRRVHRTFFERFNYMAIYECQKCEREELVPRRFRYHLGPTCRCPVCGTFRVVRLKQRDKIDRMHGGFLNLVERVIGKNKLYHCRWCRLQYYDRRPLASEMPSTAPAAVPSTVAAGVTTTVPASQPAETAAAPEAPATEEHHAADRVQ